MLSWYYVTLNGLKQDKYLVLSTYESAKAWANKESYNYGYNSFDILKAYSEGESFTVPQGTVIKSLVNF